MWRCVQLHFREGRQIGPKAALFLRVFEYKKFPLLQQGKSAYSTLKDLSAESDSASDPGPVLRPLIILHIQLPES